MEPTSEQREQITRKYFGGTRPDLHWKDLSATEQASLLDEFRQRGPSAEELANAAEVDRRMAAASNGKSSARRIFESTKGYVERSFQEYTKRLPQLLEKDLSAIVQKAILNEMSFHTRRQESLSAQADERIGRLSQRLDAYKAYDGKARCQVLEQWIGELQDQVRELQKATGVQPFAPKK
jgi:hypothetical protein